MEVLMQPLVRLSRKAQTIIIKLVALVLMVGLSAAAVAADLSGSNLNYGLHSTIYQWFGQLDTANPAHESSHHILNIGQPNPEGVVEVKLESQVARPGQGAEQGRYPGRYEERLLRVSKTFDKVLSSQSVVDTEDDFDSKYRPSRAINLIKSLVYGWTHSLDVYDSSGLQSYLLANVEFVAAEAQVKQVDDYVPYLLAQNYLKNHRDLSKLAIQPIEAGQDHYLVTFEYQWWAVSQQGNTEVAQMAVEMQVHIISGRAMIKTYQEVYLAPITDKGAEVRC